MNHLEEAVEIVHAGPKPGPRALRSRLRRRLWQLSILATRPYGRYQDRLNVAVISAVGDASYQAREVARATALIESRLRVLEDQLAEDPESKHDDVPTTMLEVRDIEGAGAVFGSFGEAGGTGIDGADDPLDQNSGLTPTHAVYLAFVSSAGSCLDLNSGTGAFLRALETIAVAYRGIESDEALAATANARGLAVEHADPIVTVRECGDGEFATVSALGLVDRLTAEEIRDLLAETHRVLIPGGSLIVEAANPWSQRAMRDYWSDIHHVRPMDPETLVMLAREAGFSSAFVFCPRGRGSFARDRLVTREYALVATA